jgi:hypothetical protein
MWTQLDLNQKDTASPSDERACRASPGGATIITNEVSNNVDTQCLPHSRLEPKKILRVLWAIKIAERVDQINYTKLAPIIYKYYFFLNLYIH